MRTHHRGRSRPTRVAAALLTAALLAVPVGCGGPDEPEGGPAPSPTDSPSAAAPDTSSTPSPSDTPLTTRFPTYVALGDSYTAAPLVGETADEGCLRSTANYPALVAEALGARLDDRSCAGAETTSLVGVQRTLQNGTAPAQFDALTTDTSLVTVGIGGNDFGVFGRLLGCGRYREQDPTGSPCREALGAEGAAALRRDLGKLGPRLESVIAGIRDRSPEAEVVVVGYPQIIPPDGTCPDLLPLAEGDHDFVAGLNRRLVEVQERAARRAGATYVDVYAASDGHDICSADPWVNGPESTPGVGLAYHPLAAEQESVARLVLEALGES